MMTVTMLHPGSCHCGAIRFTVEVPANPVAQECNCSICSKAGFIHLIVPLSQFMLIQGADAITTYTFNTGVAKHTFCRVCGVKPFYTPRSNPDGIDVKVRCLATPPANLTIEPFDGRNWEQNAAGLAHLSKT